IGAVLVLAGLVLAVAALGLNAVDGATAGGVLGLGAVAVVAQHLARKHRLRAAAWAIVGGLCVVFVGALGLLPGDAVAPWLCLVVLLASALLGWRRAAAVSIALAIGVMVAMDTGWTALNARLALSAMLLGAAA